MRKKIKKRAQGFINDELFLKELGKHLANSRKKVGLSQIQVSEIFGYKSSQFISSLERGKALPPLDKIKLMVSLYDLDRRETLEIFDRHTRRILGEIFLNKKC